ncbi:MAG: GNAT family N-acetyltransferase [Chloroflexi bacterium]|nr:GNAT family N-acetyltransferase [Chloroflexota bacterium]
MHEDTTQKQTIIIRRAILADAAHACQVLVRSIREICAKDYGHDEALLAQWCANKTVENVTEWITNPGHYFLVAETAPLGIVGVGLLHMPAGQIALCYIVPEVLHQGVGKRLLAAMEEQARTLGHTHVRLDSSITARPFYLRNGYLANGAPTQWQQITGFPLIKHFADPQPSHAL